MVRSPVKPTTRVTSRTAGRPGRKVKEQTTSFYVQPGSPASKSKGVRIDVPAKTFNALIAEPERFKSLFET